MAQPGLFTRFLITFIITVKWKWRFLLYHCARNNALFHSMYFRNKKQLGDKIIISFIKVVTSVTWFEINLKNLFSFITFQIRAGAMCRLLLINISLRLLLGRHNIWKTCCISDAIIVKSNISIYGANLRCINEGFLPLLHLLCCCKTYTKAEFPLIGIQPH